MVFWLLILILGIITYWVLQRSVSQITTTPVWILWLVIMTPALIWTTWLGVYGQNEPIPPALVILPFILCPLFYLSLVQWGQKLDSRNSAKDAKPGSVRPNSTEGIKENVEARPIDRAEEANLRNCFPWTVYHLRNLEFRPQAVICRGQLRSQPEIAYQTIREKIEEKFGDRFLVVFQNSLQGKPFFALVPNPYSDTTKTPLASEPMLKPIWAFGLLLVTLFTTSRVGSVEIAGISNTALQANPQLLLEGLSYGVSLIAILGVHELGHYLTAQFYKIKATLPYFIPIPFFLGTLGAYIQIRSPIPNRKVLFDLNVAGPIAGFLITVPLLIWGLAHSAIVPLSESSGIFSIHSFNPSFSFLLTLLSKIALGGQLTLDKALDLHPVAVAGCVGLMVTALNLIPVGSLDGGHIVHAMFGQRTGIAIGQISRFLLLLLSFIHREFLFLVILLFFLPLNNEPALNDVSELDNKRDLVGLLMLILLAGILLPTPKAVIQLLF